MAASPPPPPEDRPGGPAGDPGGYQTAPGAHGQTTGESHPPGQAPQGSWAQPYQPGPAQPGTGGGNGLAVGALVCGILALLCGIGGIFLITLPLAFILGIVGIVLGIMGMRKAAVTGTGRGQGIAGIVTGAIGLLAAIGWAVMIGIGWSAMVSEFGDPFEDPESFQERLDEFEDQQQQEDL